MIPFADFFKDLCSNYVWYERSILHHKPETFKKVCDDVYTIHSADQNRPFPPIEESRRFVSNKLNKLNPDKVKVDWVTKALEKHEQEKQAEWIPVTGEERQRRLAEFKAIIDSMPMVNNFPRLKPGEKEANGDWIASKGTPHPSTSPMQWYVKERHLAYLSENYEPRTKEPLPGWVDETTFNLAFDDKNYDEYAKLFNPKKL